MTVSRVELMTGLHAVDCPCPMCATGVLKPLPARQIPCQHPRTFHTMDGEGGGWCVLCGMTLAQIRGYDPYNYRGSNS